MRRVDLEYWAHPLRQGWTSTWRRVAPGMCVRCPEFREAIALYYNRSPGEIREFPRKLRGLIKDPRYPNTQKYLQRIYGDPITGQVSWGAVAAADGRIIGGLRPV